VESTENRSQVGLTATWAVYRLRGGSEYLDEQAKVGLAVESGDQYELLVGLSTR